MVNVVGFGHVYFTQIGWVFKSQDTMIAMFKEKWTVVQLCNEINKSNVCIQVSA